MDKFWHFLALTSLLAWPLFRQARRYYDRMASLPERTTGSPLPSLTIIVPARNEAENLHRLLPSLTAVHYPGAWDVLVVDDNSTDETAAVVQQYGAQLLSLSDLPADWLGKPNACHQAVQVTQSEWLLFTDADTRHAPEGPARAVAFAEANNLDGLSLFISHEAAHWLHDLTLSTAHAGLFAGLAQPDGLLNGQYILLRRDVYEASGGFAAVRHEALEDLALGHWLRRSGYHVPILRSEGVAQVRMYHDFKHMWSGLSRIGSGSLKWFGKGAVPAMLLTTTTAIPVYVGLQAVIRRRSLWPALWAWLTAVFSFTLWARRPGSPWWALLAPLGACLVQLASTWGLINHWLKRGTIWKDRVVR